MIFLMTWRVLLTFFGGGGGGDNGDDGDGLEDYGDRVAFPGWVVRESESRV